MSDDSHIPSLDSLHLPGDGADFTVSLSRSAVTAGRGIGRWGWADNANKRADTDAVGRIRGSGVSDPDTPADRDEYAATGDDTAPNEHAHAPLHRSATGDDLHSAHADDHTDAQPDIDAETADRAMRHTGHDWSLAASLLADCSARNGE